MAPSPARRDHPISKQTLEAGPAEAAFFLGDSHLSYLRMASHPGHPRLWRTIITEADLDLPPDTVDTWPADRSPSHYRVAALHNSRGHELEIHVDLVSGLAHAFTDKIDQDQRYEDSTGRWRGNPDRRNDFVAADAGSIRLRLMHPYLLGPAGIEGPDRAEDTHRLMMGTAGALAYLSDPYFAPRTLTRRLLHRNPLPPKRRHHLVLPSRHLMIFHDGIPIQEVAEHAGSLPAATPRGLINGDHQIIGGLLTTVDHHGQHRLNEEIGFLIVALRTPGYHAIQALPARYGDHPAGQLLYQYATLPTFEGWTAPPPTPHQPHGRATRAWIKRLARSDAGRAGAFLQVRTIRHTPPPEQPAEHGQGAPAGGKPLTYQHPRRAHTRPNVRVGIRDEHGRRVGPVYGPNAIEGVTFHRVSKDIDETTVRPDLPERPGPSPVRVLPATLTTTDAAASDQE
ncbi:hypothetical protein ACFY4C_41730 [Actinomadura viridis]|uniref:hypothetical protein n=1 Tax=Actinomadura viridis TaxID=58110 RepID=UPI0036B0FBBE